MLSMSERRLRWDTIVPDRWAWLRLVASPTSYLLALGLVVTMAAKLGVARGLHGIGFVPLRWLLACAIDIGVLMGVAAILAVGERVSRWMYLATVPLALVVALVAIINAGYLSISGDQLTWQIFSVGLDRFGDVRGIVGGTLFVHPLKTTVALVVLAGAPVLAFVVLRRARQPQPFAGGGTERARAAGVLAAICLVIALVTPTPRSHALGKLSTSGVARMYWGLVAGGGKYRGGGEMFAGYTPKELVDAAAIEKLRSGPRPNILFVILESTRRDVTSLPGATGEAKTPNLAALAARGTDVVTARAVFPHTTKSVWSMLCGRLPMMQSTVFENTSAIDVQCVPRVLDQAGWRTGFFQSAIGYFEDRPRLVDRLGYADFLSADHITADLLGYLATEDTLLAAPVLAWIDKTPEPFFATVLTSATHHPYLLSPAHEDAVKAARRPIDSDRERYDRLVEHADMLIGDLLAGLAARGKLDNTIVIVLGDHGEGFGDHGIRQHDSNYFEEGLRVPWVMAGPGIPHRTIATPAVLADLAPTLLAFLGVAPTEAATRATIARDVAVAPPDRVLPFGCFFDMNCRGFVQGTDKVVYIPETAQAFAFDLAKDPGEENPGPVPERLEKTLDTVQDIVDAQRAPQDTPRPRPEVTRYPRWLCKAHNVCKAIEPLRR